MNPHNQAHERPLWDEALPVRIDAVIRTWLVWLAPHDPWDSMRLDDVTGELRPLATALVNAACDDAQERRRRIARAAYAHGLFRRAQRFPKRLLGAELAVLREAIRTDLESSYWSDVLINQAIDGLTADLRLARQLAKRAYDWSPHDSLVLDSVELHAER
jgi:hypothetical protein